MGMSAPHWEPVTSVKEATINGEPRKPTSRALEGAGAAGPSKMLSAFGDFFVGGSWTYTDPSGNAHEQRYYRGPGDSAIEAVYLEDGIAHGFAVITTDPVSGQLRTRSLWGPNLYNPDPTYIDGTITRRANGVWQFLMTARSTDGRKPTQWEEETSTPSNDQFRVETLFGHTEVFRRKPSPCAVSLRHDRQAVRLYPGNLETCRMLQDGARSAFGCLASRRTTSGATLASVSVFTWPSSVSLFFSDEQVMVRHDAQGHADYEARVPLKEFPYDVQLQQQHRYDLLWCSSVNLLLLIAILWSYWKQARLERTHGQEETPTKDERQSPAARPPLGSARRGRLVE